MCCSHLCQMCDNITRLTSEGKGHVTVMSALWYTWIQNNMSNFKLNQSVKTEIKKSSKSSKAPNHWKQGTRLNFMMFTGHSGHSYVTSFRSWRLFNRLISVNSSKMQHISLWSEAQNHKGRSRTRAPVSPLVRDVSWREEEHPSNLFHTSDYWMNFTKKAPREKVVP